MKNVSVYSFFDYFAPFYHKYHSLRANGSSPHAHTREKFATMFFFKIRNRRYHCASKPNYAAFLKIDRVTTMLSKPVQKMCFKYHTSTIKEFRDKYYQKSAKCRLENTIHCKA